MFTFTQFNESRYPLSEFGKKMNVDAEEFLKNTHALMKSKGYNHSAIKQSASVEHRYEKPGQKFSISGWHGTGSGNRDYGGGKTVHMLFHNPNHPKPATSYKPVIELDQKHWSGEVATNYEAHKKHLQKITDYLNKHA